MKLRALAVLCLTLVATAQSLGAQAVDCQIEKSDYFVMVGKSLRMSPDAVLEMTVQGKLRNGETVTYAKDEPVVVADVQILRTTPSFVASSPLTLTADGGLIGINGLKVRIPGKHPLPALQEVALPDGRVFSIVPVTQEHAVVVNKASGELCNVAISYRVPDPYWAHNLRVEPVDGSVLESNPQVAVADSAGVRIIFTGVSAGQLNFQEIWVAGSAIRSSVTRSFDQFAKSVRIGLFDFEVVSVADGKVTLRYELQARSPVKSSDVTKAGLLPGTFAGSMVVRPRK